MTPTSIRKEIPAGRTERCTCIYGEQGVRIGICLRCATMQFEAFYKGQQKVLNSLEGKIEELDIKANAFYDEEHKGYRRAILDIKLLLQEIKEGKE